MSVCEKEIIEVKVSDVVFREDLYPRIDRDPAMVQRYSGNIECLPPIELNQYKELIDGWHRWTAHKTAKLEAIKAIITHTANESEFLALACRRNATAGKQLSEKDKGSMAVRLYNSGKGVTKEEIASVLSVTIRMVTDYLKDTEAAMLKQREETMLAMWLACHTQQVIGDAVGVDQKTVSNFLQNLEKTEALPKILKSAISHEGDFDHKQIYAIWNFAKATNNVRHFGNIPPEIIDNLLYYYTKPFDVVFDPFGGGGSTIDMCKKRMRRYFVSDLTPIDAREHEIRKHDITTGLPDGLPVPDLVFLDPPYWKQAEEKYSKLDTDLGNVDLESFLKTIGNIAKDVKRKWSGAKRTGGKLALIIGPCKEDGKNIDLAFMCYEAIAKYLKPIQRICVPYSTQVHGGAFVEKAKEKKEILYLFRDLMVFTNE